MLGTHAGAPPGGVGLGGVSGAVHLPYVVALGSPTPTATSRWPIRSPAAEGALLAGIGGIVLLGDDVDGGSAAAIVVAAGGMVLLAVAAQRRQVAIALFVAATIGTYTLVDSHAAREVDDVTYVFAVFAVAGVLVTLYGLVGGRARPMAAALSAQWRRFTLTATMSLVTYGLVLLAVRRAPVGYVAA